MPVGLSRDCCRRECDVKPSSSDLRIWGVGTSRTLRPHWALAELGLEYESREVLP